MTDSNFRVLFETSDGSLIMNRPADRELYVTRNNQQNQPFVNDVLKRDCVTKGVRLVSYKFDAVAGIRAIVDWL